MYGFFLYIAVTESDVGSRVRGFFQTYGYTVDDDNSDIDYRLLNSVNVESNSKA